MSALRLRQQQRWSERGPQLRPLAYISVPIGLVLFFFVAPMVILFIISLEPGGYSGTGLNFSNYSSLLSDPLYRHVALTTVEIATIAMAVQLLLAVPLAYAMAYRAGRFEIPLLLLLVLADELNPIVRIYAWRILLGRHGIINSALESVGLINRPIDALLFNKFAVIVVLSTSWLTYTTIPIYAAMKGIGPELFEAARDLGAGPVTTLRRIVIPLVAPGIFVAVLLVYIPLFTEFATPSLVGGTSGYMLGNAVQDLILQTGDFGSGAALSFILLLASAIVAVIAFRLARISRLESA